MTQQKLEENAVENQAEDEVENHVDEANKVQMVEEVSHEEQQPCETTGGAAISSHQMQDCRRAEGP